MSDNSANFQQQNQNISGDQKNFGSISGSVGHIGDNINQIAPREPTFPIISLPPHNPHFIGRTAHLQTLANATDATAITQAIAGLGGVGKSQLMLHFAHRQRDKYDVIWWLRVDEALAEDFLALGRELALPVDGIDQAAALQGVRIWLNSTNRHWLLLYDNADEIEPRELRSMLPSSPTGRILITSRSPRWQGLAEVVRLDVFREDEAAVFWTERLGYREEALRAALAEELGRLPLAMEHAAAYMAVNDLDAADYLKLYRTRRQELWQRATPPDDYHATITTTWEIAFEKARESRGVAELLNLCCFLAPDDIPLGLLVEHADTMPDELASILPDELALNDALSALEHYSLLERAAGMLSIHRLVQAVARDRIGKERAKKWVEAAVDFLAETYNFNQHDMATWAACGQLMPHLAVATELGAELNLLTNHVAFLNNEAGVYLDIFGNLSAARPYYERALAIREQALGPNPQNEALLRSTAQSLNNLGYLLDAMGDLDSAKPYFERALAIYEQALGPNHPDTATSLNNLGYLLQAMGDLDSAKPYYERALAIREQALGPNHPDTATSYWWWGIILQEEGQPQEAQSYFQRAYDIYNRVLGPDHPRTKAVRSYLT